MTTEHSNSNAAVALGEHDPYAALRFANFCLYLIGNFLSTMGLQMQIVMVELEVYERTDSTMALGLIGLVQVLPVILLTLVTGHVADRFDRKAIVILAMGAIALASIGLAWISYVQGSILAVFACVLAIGVARAFHQPAKASLLVQIVPRPVFANAVTWSTGTFQMAAAAGPVLGGMLVWRFGSYSLVYILNAFMAISFCGLLLGVRRLISTPPVQAATLKSLVAGVEFVWRKKILLAAMALDMFAVLLGGAVALLPVYASDEILGVGPAGLGWLRASQAIGALLMGFSLAHRRPMEHAGRALLWSVAGFGVATIVFGFSRWYWLSLAMLFLTGALDNISVIVRHTLVQLLTPDEMRGRVSAVNSMFIGASNELGAFESGAVAALLGGGAIGATLSVVSGGVGTIIVVIVLAALVPQLRNYGRLDGSDVEPSPDESPQPEVVAESSDTTGFH